MRTTILHTAAAAAILAVFLPAAPLRHAWGPARALAQDDDAEITRMAKEHFKLGLEAYTTGKYDQAIAELKQAYLLKRIPAILFNIALTYRKAKDTGMAVYYYKKYLEDAPPGDKQRPVAQAALSQLEDEQERAAAQKPAPAAPAAAPAVAQAAPDQPAPLTIEWSHTPIDAVPPSAPVDVRVQAPVVKGVKVKVFFRKEGQASWDSLEMKRRGTEKIARLPATVAQGRTFQYYIEARDPAGALVHSAGSDASPNIVLIDPNARPHTADETDEAEEPAHRFSRDIENESASFDLLQQQAMDKLHQQLVPEQKHRKILGKLGWLGVSLAAAGVAAGVGGLVAYGFMRQRQSDVTLDSQCVSPYHTVAGMCPFYSGAGSLQPSTAALDSDGQTFNAVWTGLGVASLPLMAGGAALITYDVLSRRAAERAVQVPPGKKKRKVKKVIEVEEPAALLTPVFSPTSVGMSAVLSF